MKYENLIKKGYKLHHKATAPGYTSRKRAHGEPKEYHGRFGDGFTVDFPRWDTSRFVTREYWIKE